jgi:PadR family transcriptional regulator, regulatory protein PadR
MAGGSSLGTADLTILLVLMRLGDEAYGVTIAREIEETSGRIVALASVYATLDRLVERGFAASELGEPTAERGGRAKKFFRITGKGVREVRAAKQSFVKLWKDLPQLG